MIRHLTNFRSKMYKEKFKNWGWGKNLPHRYAQWMVQKAQHRRREESKDTIFFYGGSVYDSTIAENRASRTKRDGPDPDLMGK
jgi:hypothetical protein